METKIVPVRMTDDEVKELDAIASKSRFWKRSDVVRAAVQFMSKYATPGMQAHIMAGYFSRWRDYNFTITNEQL